MILRDINIANTNPTLVYLNKKIDSLWQKKKYVTILSIMQYRNVGFWGNDTISRSHIMQNVSKVFFLMCI